MLSCVISGALSFISWGNRALWPCRSQAFICCLFNPVEHMRSGLPRETFTGQSWVLKSVYLWKNTWLCRCWRGKSLRETGLERHSTHIFHLKPPIGSSFREEKAKLCTFLHSSMGAASHLLRTWHVSPSMYAAARAPVPWAKGLLA